MFTTNVRPPRWPNADDDETTTTPVTLVVPVDGGAKFAWATPHRTPPASHPNFPAPHAEASASLVLLCFLMSCHVLYEMSSASAMPKMVGSGKWCTMVQAGAGWWSRGSSVAQRTGLGTGTVRVIVSK